MTAPTCGARTVRLSLAVRSLPSDEDEITEEFARELIADLQSQLDALDPDAAVAEAERAWLAALERAATLDAMLSEVRDVEASSPFARRRDALLAAVKRADAHAEQAEAAWLALVEARDAKGGGA